MRTAIRIIVGGILAGVAVFFWGFIAHMFTPIGRMGIQGMPGEELVGAYLKNVIQEPGLYIFPAPDFDDPMNADKSKALAEKSKKGPAGILIFQPNGTRFAMSQQLGFELASNIAAALLAALLLTTTRISSFAGRVLFVASLGLFGWMAVSVSHWTWYAFPTDFTIAALADEVGGFLIAGVVLGLIIRPVPAKPEP